MPPGTAGPVVLRLARLEDAAQITAIHQSHIPRWYRMIGDVTYDVSYDNLTIDERWGFGGPWMSAESCVIHLNNMLLRRCVPIVAQAGDQVVAEMELFIGREGPPYFKNCHIGLLYVHKDFTGRGIGRKMVEKAADIARQNDCDTLTVSAVPACEKFYRKCNFSFEDAMVEIEAHVRRYPADAIALPPPVNLQSFTWAMDMKIGRYQSSSYHVFEISDAYALPVFHGVDIHRAAFSVDGNPSMFAAVNHPDAGFVAAVGWTAGADIRSLVAAELTWFERLGLKTANFLLSRKDYDILGDQVEHRLVGQRGALVYRL
jgi:predicted GNAT family acetyltransferase